MIRHLFKLIWNRKRANALVIGEIAVSFLVLCVVLTAAIYCLDNWRRPLGFEYRDAWCVRIDYGNYQGADDNGKRATWETLMRLESEAQQMDGVEAATLMTNVPYSNSTSTWQMKVRGKGVNLDLDMLWGAGGLQAVEAMRFDIVAGRWFEAQDAATAWRPIVVNRRLARDLFRSESPLGQSMPSFEEDGTPRDRKPDETDYRVVGVIADYRRDGEPSASPYVAFQSPRIDPEHSWPSSDMIVRARPGTTAVFEEQLYRRLHDLAPEWSFDVRSLTSMRHERLRSRVLPLIVAGIAAGFLILMVGMGLMGVLWLNVTRRTRELGLRRALGATGAGVRAQIIGELLTLTTIAVAAGALVYLQAPILGLVGSVAWRIYGLAILASLVILYSLVALCGLYPSWLATRVDPAQALHYE